LEKPGRVSNGEILFKGSDICDLPPEQMRRIRGDQIGMIFQDPQTSLNPLLTIGEQLVETIQKSHGLREREATARAVELLEGVGITEAELRLKAYPHQFSGGMRQRVVIALALAGDPDLVIADEPTTALDVSIQAQILDLIKGLCRSRNLGVLIVTHDIGVIANIADRVAVMYRGEVVEIGEVAQILGAPRHEYTKSLIAAVPRADRRLERFTSIDYIEGGAKPFARIDVPNHWLGGPPQIAARGENAVEVKNLELAFTLKKSLFKSNLV
jgi:peptide/nickel transport system ATP-binding protein